MCEQRTPQPAQNPSITRHKSTKIDSKSKIPIDSTRLLQRREADSLAASPRVLVRRLNSRIALTIAELHTASSLLLPISKSRRRLAVASTVDDTSGDSFVIFISFFFSPTSGAETSAMAAPASDSDASAAAIEQLYQFGERLNESKDKSKVIILFCICRSFTSHDVRV